MTEKFKINQEIKPAEENIEVPEKLRNVSEEDVIEAGQKAWNPIMKKLRNERGRDIAKKWVAFNLPLIGEPGREYPLTALTTKGCSHALRGGCTFCDYGFGEKFSVEKTKKEIEEIFEHIDKAHVGYDRAYYNINAIGSFFDDEEIPEEIRNIIYRKIKEREDGFEQIEFLTESRLEFITEDKLKAMRDALGNDVLIEVGYGMESTQPLVRDGVVNKHLPEDYEEKIELLRKYNIQVAGHVIVKPPFLSEKEAVEDAVNTIRTLLDEENNLADLAIVMTMNNRPSTLVGKLTEEKKYELPSIWSTIEIMKKIGPKLAKRCGFFGFSVADSNAETVNGCQECKGEIFDLLNAYTGNEDQYIEIIEVAEKTDCECKKAWKERMEDHPQNTLAERIAGGIDSLGKEYLNKSFEDFLQKK